MNSTAKIIILILNFFILAPYCTATPIRIYEVDFDLENTNLNSDESINFKLNGKDSLIQKDNIPKFYLDYLFNNSNGQYYKDNNIVSTIQIKKLVQNIGIINENDIKIKILTSFLLDKRFSTEEKYNWIEDPKNSNNSSHLISNVLNYTIKKDFLDFRVYLKLIYTAWKTNQLAEIKDGLELIYQHQKVTKEWVTSQYRQALVSELIEKADSFYNFYIFLFPIVSNTNDPMIEESFLIKEFYKYKELNDKENIKKLLLISEKSNVTTENTVLPTVIFKYLNQIAEEEFKKNKLDKVLYTFSYIPLAHRTPETHQIILQTLTKCINKNISIESLKDANVILSLRTFAENDVEIKMKYIQLLAQSSLNYLNNSRFIDAEKIFGEILSLNPDPSDVNNDLRLQFGKSYARRGLKNEALDKINFVIQDSLFPKNFFLEIWKIYSLMSSGSLLIFGVLIVSTIFFFLRKAKPKIKKIRNVKHEEYEENNVYSFVRNVNKISPELAEYYESLAILGLNTNAKLQEIKFAYRESVKKFHPDKTKNDESSTDKIILIKKNYEKVIKYLKQHPDHFKNQL